MRKPLAPSALALSALTFGLLALQAIQPASARSAREEISPAEEQVFPYDANIPGCQDTGVLEEISSKFAEKEAKYWNTSLTIASYDTISRTAWRPYGVDFIPRRYCSAVATTSDGVRRRIDYSVRESLGFISATWGVDYCVHGLDRNLAYAYSTACRMARP
ncbi:hypothetical protein [Methylobacterium brachythecii]|uniref:Uncharacterized protein n=1 Tax=Methylobacterium brachythecii TaxID=1176177 RepID=A0A7W6AEA8_9HYPH|nr:hypothetical protein [Methylobacterium brachythecii]GLS43925.1 hypothetical protein GCM10007884_19110 [Methylobacterium brachythecii]